jgi:hypothetical protein
VFSAVTRRRLVVTDVMGQRVIPSSGVRTSVLDILTLEDGTDGCPETSF